MEIFSDIALWIGENETLLSGLAAIVVVISFVASPLGAGLRGLVRRRETPQNDEKGPLADIPTAIEPEADRPSIAVLPFAPASKDDDGEIFADGMASDIIRALGHVPGFFVTSGNSTFVYKDRSVDTRQIGRELGVRYVVEGRVQNAADEVRVNTTLVEAATGDQIWSEQFSGNLSDIFALQDEVTRSIVGQIQPKLMQAEWRRGTRTPTENLDAWTLLHSARMRFHLGHGRDASEEAIRLAETALGKDPHYAEAHGFLAEALVNRLVIQWSDDPERDAQKCDYHCRKALELDAENPIVLYGAAARNFFTGRSGAAIEQIEQCCGVNPNDAFAQSQRGMMLSFAGRGDEGLEAADLALRLSPRDPRIFWLLTNKAYALFTLGQYKEAERINGRSLDLNDGYIWSWFVDVLIQAMQRRKVEGRRAALEIQRLSPDLKLEDIAKMLRDFGGNPTGDRGEVIERQISSLRDVWPA